MCEIVLAIVGNKCDLTDKIEVEAEEAEEYAKVQWFKKKKEARLEWISYFFDSP